ncbi:hypothetical protein [Nocardia gamkensis]|uniref:hypothetical protein n=1 Tax=Nocardia gamkensis TaxID=352869 RepID=UPI0037C748C2
MGDGIGGVFEDLAVTARGESGRKLLQGDDDGDPGGESLDHRGSLCLRSQPDRPSLLPPMRCRPFLATALAESIAVRVEHLSVDESRSRGAACPGQAALFRLAISRSAHGDRQQRASHSDLHYQECDNREAAQDQRGDSDSRREHIQRCVADIERSLP